MDGYFWIILLVALLAFKIYTQFFFDAGKYGENLTFKVLQNLNDYNAGILSNIYLLKNSKGETTEIDIVMIRSSGIYVFESKNYSGWIFGSTKDRTWTQTLPGRRAQKHSFLNPIHQNNLHIRCLKEYLNINESSNIPIYSIIVFSERCTFKRVNVQDSGAYVIKRNDLKYIMQQIHSAQNIQQLSPAQIDEYYQKLLLCTNVSNEVKEKHIQDIRNSHQNKYYRK